MMDDPGKQNSIKPFVISSADSAALLVRKGLITMETAVKVTGKDHTEIQRIMNAI